MERLCTRLGATLRRVFDSRAEFMAAKRFFRNPKVKAREIIATAAAGTAAASQGRHVLLIEDTSEINYADKAGRKRGLGTVGNGTDVGLFVHPALAVDAADGSVLGLAGATIWRRLKKKAKDYQADPIETKESFRWIDTVRTARAGLPAASVVTIVADREADIYELFARLPEAGRDGIGPTHLLIRCSYDRALVKDGKRAGTLNETVARWSEAGRYDIDVTARPGRPARRAKLSVRFGTVQVRQPRTGAAPNDPRAVELRLVEVSELDPPAGQKPVHWRLYTTHAVDTLADALLMVEMYRRRWIIEQLFRTLKSQGLGIEDSLLADGEALENLIAASLLAAVRVMQCVQARDEAGIAIPALRAFTPDDMSVLTALNGKLQGRTDKQKNPFAIETLAWASWVIARLGGWTGYKSERKPGPITMYNGLTRFQAIAQGFALALTACQ